MLRLLQRLLHRVACIDNLITVKTEFLIIRSLFLLHKAIIRVRIIPQKGDDSMLSSEQYKDFVHILLDMGEKMLSCGAEINRIEYTISKMAKSYGAVRANVFVINSSIVLTVEFSTDALQITESRRVKGSSGINLLKLERYNSVSRRCAKNPMPLDELRAEIEAVPEKSNSLKFYVGCCLAAGSFSVFFGGSVYDGLAAAFFALIIGFLQRKLSPLCPNNIIFNFIASLTVGFAVCPFTNLFSVFSRDKILIGEVMLLIPGIAVTNALRDVFVGDTISGSMRVIEGLFWTVGIVAGFMVAIFVVGV